MRSENFFKITSIVLAVLLILVIGFVAYDKINAWKTSKYNQIYTGGYNQCLTDSISQIFKNTDNCGIVSLTLQNQTRSLADFSCIQKAIQQGLNQTG